MFSEPENHLLIPQPAGLHLGGANPPDPLGMPIGRTAAADINFCTSAQSHFGQLGAASSGEKASCSKQWQQALH